MKNRRKNTFHRIRAAAVDPADRVIEHERVIAPSARDAKSMLDLLDKPPAPNAKLRAALKRYREAFGGPEDRASL